MSKIDTQGMSGPATGGGTDNVYEHDENGDPILPPMKITPLTLIEPKLKVELKELINEVLDEREAR
jgi:hypothetical protein